MALYKRYQHFVKDGIEWSPWFKVERKGEDVQYKSGKVLLKNEYEERDE